MAGTGVSVGASAQYSLLQSEVVDYNGAFEYKQNDLTLTAAEIEQFATALRAELAGVAVAGGAR